ncbi:MAG TPA: orotidine-5'-phosphate decarboxylase [Gaiellaceae bacterium]|jgi:orotidine-5'-phosphate decarboxylase|nr:orotidine-5'-phosphate decarboxylase [Gaiellaceae bacterium]
MAQNLEAGVDTAASTFADRLADAVDRKRSQLLVGLDPRPELLPVELRGETYLSRGAAADACARFCRGLIDAVAPYVVGVKLQLAFFEALGSDGLRAYEEVRDYARAATLLVVADAKRGDIGSTARAYADAYLENSEDERVTVDALTVNPYLGRDSIEPFLAACRRSGSGLFCVVKTSNAGSADVQDLALSDGRRVWQQVAELVNEWGAGLVGERGLSSVGAVVGATYPRAVAEARRLMPQAILLLPGIGAQGATPADVARAFTSGPASALVPVSRSVIYAFRVEGADWRKAAAAEAARLRGEVWAVSGW